MTVETAEMDVSAVFLYQEKLHRSSFLMSFPDAGLFCLNSHMFSLNRGQLCPN